MAKKIKGPTRDGKPIDMKKEMQAAITVFRQSGSVCALCASSKWDAIGMWTPSPEYQKLVGAPLGKTRMVAYPICSSCILLARDNPAYVEKIETSILAQGPRA